MRRVDILLVEDNLDDAGLTIRALKRKTTEDSILHLASGEEALDFIFCKGTYACRAIEQLPKLVLLDLKMPKVDGMEVLRKIKSDDRTRMIPTIVLTSSNENKDILESYQLGVNSYLVKPVDFSEFMEAVASLSHYWLELNQAPIKG